MNEKIKGGANAREDVARAGRPADMRALGLAAGFTCYRKPECGCTTFCAALRDGIEHHLHDVVPASVVRNKALEDAALIVEAEGPCRHVDHVQGFCACQEKADAIRALIAARSAEPKS